MPGNNYGQRRFDSGGRTVSDILDLARTSSRPMSDRNVDRLNAFNEMSAELIKQSKNNTLVTSDTVSVENQKETGDNPE